MSTSEITTTATVHTVGIDSLMINLFKVIHEDNVPWLLAAGARLRSLFGEQLIDLVPSYTTLLVHYDLLHLDNRQARALVAEALRDLTPTLSAAGRAHVLPVWYDPRVGPELGSLARRSGLSTKDVIRRHCEKPYQVFALGFTPGFAFMGLVEETLAAPRLRTPRKRVAAGSVGIAERQTAAYPSVSPGGWNLIGRTPSRLFDTTQDGFSLLRPGDSVQFSAISHSEFIHLGGDDTPLEAQP
ncbi:allophanate hydrolase subunit 1 [Pseudomonas sp. NA-150]|uniref:5-oxoprolinase subunit B family protein n=1 Tax=Pseudomonas sp. NA-150 TaxID=3367525 RepID=UPI0037CA31A3